MTIYFFFHIRQVMIAGRVMLIGSVITLIMALFSIEGRSAEVRWNRPVFFSMTAFGIGMFLVGLLHSVGDGFVLFPADLAVIFPFFYYVWINRGDHETLYRMLSFTVLLLGIISFLYCILLAGRGTLMIMDERVAGHMLNANFLGCIGAVLFMISIFLLSELIDSIRYVVICSLGLGIGITYVVISGSRTALLSEISSMVVMVVFTSKIRSAIKMTGKDICIRLGILIGAVLIITYAGLKLDDINYRAMQSAGNGSGEMTEVVQLVYAEDDAPASADDNTIIERFDTSDDLNSFSSGRLEIWRIYASNLSWLGRPFSQIEEQLSAAPETRAHNNFLEYFYRCGYIVGSMYVLFYIAVGIEAFRRLISRKHNSPSDMLLVMIVFTYMGYSLVEVAFLPFTRIVPCLFFLMIAPLMGDKEIEKSQ